MGSVSGGPLGFIWGWGKGGDGPDVFLPQHPLCPRREVPGVQVQGAVLEDTGLGFGRRLWLSFGVKG